MHQIAEIGGVLKVDDIEKMLNYEQLKKWFIYLNEKEKRFGKIDFYFAQLTCMVSALFGGDSDPQNYLIENAASAPVKVDQSKMMYALAAATGATIKYVDEQGNPVKWQDNSAH